MKQYILITGASSGVGKELAIALSEQYNLVICGRDYERLNQTKTQCNSNAEIMIWQYDLADNDNLERCLRDYIKENGISIFSFVHCAGVMKMLPCKVFSVEAFEGTYRVNVFAAALIMKILTARRVNAKNLKSAVFISSNISNRGASAFGIYGSSKAALDGLMRSLAIELAPNVRINSILPGGMITEMTKEMFEDSNIKEKFNRNYPLGIGEAKQIIPMVEFLISEKSDWITGQQFVVDGGRTIDITERE